MSDNVTRISLAAVLDGDRTDWSRLKAMSDTEIEAAASGDADSFAADPASSRAVSYAICRYAAGAFRWHLIDGDGEIVADGRASFASREAVEAALEELRLLVRNARLAA